jgi:hypothetical protein
MPNTKIIDDLISDVAEKIEDEYDNTGSVVPIVQINLFMLDCLSLIEEECPKVAKKGISVATDFCEGLVSAEDLAKARAACWKYLDKKNITFNDNKIETCRVKAVISAMDSEMESYNVCDSLLFFCAMLKRSGVSYLTIETYLRKHFIEEKKEY